jgi:hypothetical protein
VFTGCDKDEDEGAVNVGLLAGVWEETYTAEANHDGFPSYKDAEEWLRAFDWEKAKEPYNLSPANDFCIFRDGKIDNYFPRLGTAEINIPYTLDGQNIIIDPDNRQPDIFRIVALSKEELVLEEMDKYMIYTDYDDDDKWDVSVRRVFFTRRTAVPDEDYTIYEW